MVRQRRWVAIAPPLAAALRPLAVVEVLSPSTMDYGRGGKLKFYKSLPTLRHVAPIYRDQMRVETFERTDEGWRIHVSTAPEGVLRSDAVDLEIDLDRTRFDAPVRRPSLDADEAR